VAAAERLPDHARNDGSTIHKLMVRDIPVDGFWSLTVYNGEGYVQPNQYNAYSVNNITAKRSADGTINIQFAVCEGNIPIACRSRKGGITRCVCFARDPKSSMARGNSSRRGL
jgi:hypothetical protein